MKNNNTIFQIKLIFLMLIMIIITQAENMDREKRVYAIPYTHLDLQWLWTMEKSINRYIPQTLKENFNIFSKYEKYNYNHEAAYRYMVIKEKYPNDYKTLKKHIKDGRWFIAGSMIEAPDVNLPSSESLIRHILYGNGFFEKEFGKTCLDVFLPDCFGFPMTLPTVAAHCGLIGFSTQKYHGWGGCEPTPFGIGIWKGVDDGKIIACLKPSDYESGLDIDTKEMNILGEKTGIYWTMDYVGKGDTGGCVQESKVQDLNNAVKFGKNGVKVIAGSSDQLFRDLTEDQIKKIEEHFQYKGELLLSKHGTGCYSAHGELKRYNRLIEQLLYATEISSVTALLLNQTIYPKSEIQENWIRLLIHQFHDDLTGTSIINAYRDFTIPDYEKTLTSLNKILDDANSDIAKVLNTEVKNSDISVPVIVYNPLAIERNDIVEIDISFSGSTPEYVKVYNSSGKEVPSQLNKNSNTLTVVFMANVPPVGYAVFSVKKSDKQCEIKTGLTINKNSLENKKYKITIDKKGDIASIYDKIVKKELLTSPSRFEIRNNISQPGIAKKIWPAWEVMYKDVISTPRSYVDENVKKEILASGPAQIVLKITRSKEGNDYIHYYKLNSDSNGYLSVYTELDWKKTHNNGSLLKASFPLTVSNTKTRYDLGIGNIERGINRKKLYEVPGQKWADITNTDKSYGVAILNDCKYGWDKPSNNKIHLTLLHDPKKQDGYYNKYQDGEKHKHYFTYGIYGHKGDWNNGKNSVDWKAAALNQPLTGFQTDFHKGKYGKTFSLIKSEPEKIKVMAIKIPEKQKGNNEIILRVCEVAGKMWDNVKIDFGADINNVAEINGYEKNINGTSFIKKSGNNSIEFKIGKYQPKTFLISF